MIFHHTRSDGFPRVNVAPPGEAKRFVLRAKCCRCPAVEDIGASRVLPLALVLGKLAQRGWRVRARSRAHDLCLSCARGTH